jgi:hypothetical protein
VLDTPAGARETLVLDTPAGAGETLIVGVGCAPPATPTPVPPAAPGAPGQPAVGRTPEVSVNSVPSALATHSGMAPKDPPPWLSCRAVR